MSRLFISHSSQNNAEAAALNLWLKEQGWDDVFLDVTPDRGIAAGERWERSLNEAASRCEAVLFCLSRAWLASRWCRKEYDLARRLSKRLFGALVEPIPVDELPAEIIDTFQMVDLASGQDHRMFRVEMPRTHEEVHVTFSQEGLFRLKDGLTRAGLDPRFFPWPPANDPERPPYRGLKALEAEDAGIFFGRDAPIIEGLDTLRNLAEAAAPRLLVILGASGAGKSSFLRAGLLPRLARDDRTFLPLPVIRPEGGSLTGETGLLPALEAALAARGTPQTRASIRQAIAAGAEGVRPLLAKLSERAFASILDGEGRPKPPLVTLAIDQAEELFTTDGEGEAFLGLVRDLVAGDAPPVIVLFTIRSDAYDALEIAKPLEGLRQRTLPLLPMPRGAYQTVIEGPAQRLVGTRRTLTIEARLTQRLLEDIERGGGSDALPLLAFTLGQLYLDFGGGGALRLEDYEAFGGIRGAIEAAVRRALSAADRDPRIPRDLQARFLLLRRGLIPWLAGIDPETGSPRRRLARMSDIPAEAEPLVRLLVEQRLLSVDRVTVKDGEGDRTEITIEPAHEALLRQWRQLRDWLTEDFSSLAVLDAVKRSARDWEANARGVDWLNHTGTRLAEAEQMGARDDLAADLGAARDYLAQCRLRDDADEAARQARLEGERQLAASQLRLAEQDQLAAEDRTRAARRFTRLAVGATAAVALGMLVAGGLGVLNHFQARQRDDALAAAEAGRWVAKSQAELRDGNPVEAVRSALRAFADRPNEATRSALLAALIEVPNLVGTATLRDGPAQALAWLSDESLGVSAQAAALRVFEGGRSGQEGAGWASPVLADLRDGYSFVRALRRVAPDRVVAVLSDGSVLAWGRGEATPAALAKAGESTVIDAAAIGRSGTRIVLAASGDGVTVATCPPGAPKGAASCRLAKVSEGAARSVAISADESLAGFGDESGLVSVVDGEGRAVGSPVNLGSAISGLGFSPDGTWLAAGTAVGEIVLVDPEAGTILARMTASRRPISAVAVSPDGRTVASACGEASACLWRLSRGPEGVALAGSPTRLVGYQGGVTALDWNPAGDRLATAFADGIVRIWSAGAAAGIGSLAWPEGTPDLARLAVSPDGARLAAAGGGTIQVWNRRSGSAPPTVLRRPDAGPEPRSLAWAGDGRLAAVYDDGSVAIWPADGTGRPEVRRWDPNANPGLAWVGGGRALAVALADGRIALHDPATGGDEFLPAIGTGMDPWGLVAAPDGAALYASYVKGEVRAWAIGAKTHVVLRAATGAAEPERGGPESLAVSPDGRWLAATADDGAIRLFATAGGVRASAATESPQTKVVALSPDGARLAALGADGRAYVWDFVDGAAARVLSFVPAAAGGRMPGDRPATWLAWADPGTLAIATGGGAVQSIPLDEAAWRRRAETLDLRIVGR